MESVIISYENDTAKWPNALENAITVGADAVYSWPDDQAMADYAAKYYRDKGVPHCLMGIDSEQADCVLIGDQAAMGKALGEQLASWVEKIWVTSLLSGHCWNTLLLLMWRNGHRLWKTR